MQVAGLFKYDLTVALNSGLNREVRKESQRFDFPALAVETEQVELTIPVR